VQTDRTDTKIKDLVLTNGLLRRFGLEVHLYTDGETLVDTGSKSLRPQLERLLPSLCNLKRVFITHHHEDHVGNARFLQEKLGVEVFAPSVALPILSSPQGQELQFYRKVFWGAPEPFEAKPLPDSFTLAGMEFKVIETNGHSFDHHAFFSPSSGILISGDLVLSPFACHAMQEEDLVMEILSLKKVASLGVRKVFCAHKGIQDASPIFAKLAFYNLVASRLRAGQTSFSSVFEEACALGLRQIMVDIVTWGHYSVVNFVRKMQSIAKNEALLQSLFGDQSQRFQIC
jgi:glyoxylase-like metal-dependent hydrolase (beta-lactamase superfamily II)